MGCIAVLTIVSQEVILRILGGFGHRYRDLAETIGMALPNTPKSHTKASSAETGAPPSVHIDAFLAPVRS